MIVSDVDDVARCSTGDRTTGSNAGPASGGTGSGTEVRAESHVGFRIERHHHGRPSGVGTA
jgi:hypothetical protein